MIYLTKGQALFNNPGMVVCDPTGYYEDGSTVTCAMFHSPNEPVCRYEAKFIAYGDQVYNISDEDKLKEEIIKIDPETLLGKTNEEVEVDKLVKEIETVENPTPELGSEPSVEEEVEPEPGEEIEPEPEVVEPEPEVVEPESEVVEPEPEIVEPEPEVVEPEPEPEPTPEIIPDTNTEPEIPAITTDEIISSRFRKRGKRIV